MVSEDISKLPDSLIPTIRAPNPILDARAETRLAQAKALHLPGMPLSVAKRAQEAATSTGVLVLLLVGLVVKLTNKPLVKIKPALLEQSGLSEYQIKRALGALSATGMVAITSGRGRRREIKLLDAEYLTWLRAKQTGPNNT